MSKKNSSKTSTQGIWWVVRKVTIRCYEEDIMGRAAQLAFFFLLALFPMLIFLASLVAYLPIPHFMDRLMAYCGEILPPAAYTLIQQTVKEVTRRRLGLLSAGLAAAIWAASSGVHALISLINAAYGIKPTRPWWKERLLAIWLTLLFSFFIIAALSLLFFGGEMGALLAREYHLSRQFRIFWNIAQWPLIILFVLFTLEIAYNSALHEKRRWQWYSPGAIFALLAWIGFTAAFKLYVVRIANYTLTYGSLGSVIVLMLWLFLTSVSILIGGQINGLLDQRQRR